MPKANWGIRASTVDDFDRDSQYKPYTGPIPPSGVYLWVVKRLQFAAATDDKMPQLRVGLELKPRSGRNESKYKGYYMMAFLNIGDETSFLYTPLLDAFGVSGRDFTNRTMLDENNNIVKIGSWRNTGDFVVAAQLVENDPDYKSKNEMKILRIFEAPEDSEVDDDDDDIDDDEDTYGDDDSDDEWDDAPKSRKRGARQSRGSRGKSTSNGRTSRRRRSRSNDEDEF